jgi:hypothetical protein
MAIGINSLFNSIKQYFNFGDKVNIQHQIILMAQQEGEESWIASIKMLCAITNTSSLKKGKGDDAYNIVTFARLNGLSLFAPQKWEVKKFISLLRKGPIAVGGMTRGSKFTVVSGIQTDGKADNTFFTVYNPHPTGIGTFLPMVSFSTLRSQFPEITTCILQK